MIVQEMRVVFQNAVEIECAPVQHGIQRDACPFGVVDDGVGIDLPYRRLNLRQLFGVHQIGLVQHDDISKRHLVLGFRRACEGLGEMTAIDHRNHSVQSRFRPHILVHEECLSDGCRIGEAGGFDQNAVEPAFAFQQPLHHPHEIAPHGAAHAAVVHFVDFLVALHDQVVVDTDLAELVDDDGELLAVVAGQDAVQQRGLARAEIAGENGDGDCIGHGTVSRLRIAA